MTFDWKHIILAIVVGIIAGCFVFVKCSDNKKLNTAIKEKHDSSVLYIALRHSVDHLIVIHARDSTFFDSVITHQPKPTWYIRYVHDTSYIDTTKPHLCASTYTDSIVKDRFHLVMDYHIVDCYMKQIRYRNIVYPVDTVKTPTIFKDTCKPQPKLSLWDWEVTPRVAYNPFDNSFGVMGEAEVSYWNISAIMELGVTTKKQVEFNVGIGYKFHKK